MVTEGKLSTASVAVVDMRNELESHKNAVAGLQQALAETQEANSSAIAKLKMSHVDQMARVNCDVDRYRREARGMCIHISFWECLRIPMCSGTDYCRSCHTYCQ